MNPKGRLYLVPTPLGESGLPPVLPAEVQQRLSAIRHFVVEHSKTARHFLKQIAGLPPLASLELMELSEHTAAKVLPDLLAPLLNGRDVGLLSEAGCPAVADPGASLVRLAHQQGIQVVPLVGPSAILLALMASGLNGQRFCFHGYLPVVQDARDEKILQLEKRSRQENETQIFIETPYRNLRLLEALLQRCNAQTQLCIACNLTLVDEYVFTRAIGEWRQNSLPAIHKRPAVFLLQG
ncbi:MAG TPA: SAM-dependent methyltransferase [Nitrosomonas mobilis]|uniref:Uroporphyrin-III C/tetrapyrrole (Corrin/Porphyrin) methyltransferase n=2 Tax=Nitrosomonas mobilis TaxID=51642 RepID=A0A1G5SD17_9PROT|nr:SAM-dependent methyltransferase [Nitrosomonas mobilis]SCZ85083.1 Uroporphyrin-III C/tetrapyrrole (Corrin/Porphyrin) methyltransferase [Nitrosomonas mobilis]HNO74661.1 SAM-dependent methyltransferase [Nitrosomonas mobilis]